MQLKAHSYCLVSLTWWFQCPAHPLYLAAAARLPWRNCFAGSWFGIAAYSYSVFVVWGSLFNFVLALSWVWMISFAEPLHCRAPLKKSPLICRCLPSAQMSGRPWVSSLYLLGLVCPCDVSRLIHTKKKCFINFMKSQFYATTSIWLRYDFFICTSNLTFWDFSNFC